MHGHSLYNKVTTQMFNYENFNEHEPDLTAIPVSWLLDHAIRFELTLLFDQLVSID